MTSMTYKPLHAEMSIASANTVNNGPLIRVINTSGSTQVLNLSLLNASNAYVQYANLTILNNNEVVVKKNQTDTVQMTGGLAVDVAYQY